jgi:hypothetical protein
VREQFMTGIILFAIGVTLIGSMLSAIGDLLKQPDISPIEDTDLAARLATRQELRRAGLVRRRW